ncbi:MAG: flagellar protein FlaG [Holophagales bacterium]|nr:flagellar protein FlaG [Holophagales bacterium]
MPDPLSMASAKGSIVPASLVNPQAQAQTAKTQAVADTIGTKKSLNAGFTNTAAGQIQSSAGAAVNNNVTKDVTRADAPNETGESDQADKDTGLPENKPPLVSEAALNEAVKTFREYLDNLPSDLKFNIDEDTDRLILKIVNPVTKEVVKQYPPDEFLSMVKQLRKMTENLADNGVFLNTHS